MSLNGIPKEVLCALAGIVGKKEVKTAKTELAPGSHDVDFVVRVTGTVSKGHEKKKKVVVQPPVDFAVLFAAAVRELDGEQIAGILDLSETEMFQAEYKENGGREALSKDVADVMGLEATEVTKVTVGSVSGKGVDVLEWAEGVNLGAIVELAEQVRHDSGVENG